MTEEDRTIIHDYLNTLDYELGFPCSHCKQKSYIRDTGKTWTDLYKEFVVYHKTKVIAQQQPLVMEAGEVDNAVCDTITTLDSSSTKSGTILSKRSKQRQRGQPVSFDTWRQFVRVVYSHVQF